MLQQVNLKTRLAAVIVILVFALVALVIAVNELSDKKASQKPLITTYQTISHPANTDVISEGECHDSGGGAGNPTCGTTFYCALLGTQSTFDKTKDYYTRQFSQRSWQQTATSVFTINDTSTLELLEVPPDTPMPVDFTVSAEALSSAWQTYTTTYLIALYSVPEGCS